MSRASCPYAALCFNLVFYREKYYMGLINDPELHVKLTGSWETIVGPELDTFRTYQNLHHHCLSSSEPQIYANVMDWYL